MKFQTEIHTRNILNTTNCSAIVTIVHAPVPYVLTSPIPPYPHSISLLALGISTNLSPVSSNSPSICDITFQFPPILAVQLHHPSHRSSCPHQGRIRQCADVPSFAGSERRVNDVLRQRRHIGCDWHRRHTSESRHTGRWNEVHVPSYFPAQWA